MAGGDNIDQDLRDPDEIAARSFGLARGETDLSGIPEELQDAIVGMVEACGMPDLVEFVRWSGDLAASIEFALVEGAALLCDADITAAGVARGELPSGTRLITLPPATTAADPLRERLSGAVVLIGSSAATLLHVLDLLDGGAPRPAAIIATPAGFGPAEAAKNLLALDTHQVPFLTVLGRRGGAPIACAALNALLRSIEA